jgi:hypothetical protein
MLTICHRWASVAALLTLLETISAHAKYLLVCVVKKSLSVLPCSHLLSGEIFCPNVSRCPSRTQL